MCNGDDDGYEKAEVIIHGNAVSIAYLVNLTSSQPANKVVPHN